MSNINLNIVGTGNFTQVEAAIKHLQASIAQLNASGMGSTAFNKSVAQSIAQVNALAQAQGLMRVHTTSLSSEADKLTKRISKGKTTFQDFRGAVAGATKANSVYMEVAKRQLAIQNMSAIQVGKNIFGYENLGRVQLKGAAAAQAHATAIAAQNAVLRQSLVHVVNWGKNMQWTGRQLTMGLTMPLVLFGAQAAKIFNEVDKNLTNLAKVYGVGLEQPTVAALQSIRKEMIALSTELGKTLGISAAEVTDIGAQFAAAGLQGEELMYATKQAARMVILGETDKQEAIKATIALQTAYKLNTTELTEAVDFFNAAQAATSTNMADLINAVPRVGPVVKQLGGTYKDMVAIITALKEGGVPAGEAANAIKNSIARIIQPTERAKESLMGFGIDIENIVNKNAGNLTATLFELQAGLNKLDNLSRQRAISDLFGKYQFTRMTAFIENFGAVGTQSQKVMEMMGLSAEELANIAEEQTKKIQQSASGRFRIAVETLKNTMIPFGEATLKIFTSVLEKVTAFFETVNDLPGPLKSALKWLLLIGGVVGPLTMIAGLFGNLLGTVGMGIVRLKVFGGALRMLFTTRDMSAAKIILAGFRELDPAVVAASKAVDLFKNKEITAEEAGERFAAMLNNMTNQLNKVKDASVQAGSAMGNMAAQGANAAASAQAAGFFSVNPLFTQGARGKSVQNVSMQHYLPATMVASALGLSGREGNKEARKYRSFVRYMPAQFDILQNAVGTTPLLYGGKFGGEEQIQQKIYQKAMEDSYKRTSLPVPMSMQQWEQFSKEASQRLPISINAMAKEYSTLFAQMEVGAKHGSKALQDQLTKIRQSGVSGEEMIRQGAAVIQKLLTENAAAQSEFHKIQAVNEQKILSAYNNATTIEQANEDVIRVLAALEKMVMSKEGMMNGITLDFMQLINAFQFGTMSASGLPPVAAMINPAEKIKEIHLAATAKLEEMAVGLNKIKEEIAATPVPKKPGILASRADRRAYETYMNVQRPEAEQALTNATRKLAQIRETLAAEQQALIALEKKQSNATAKMTSVEEKLNILREKENALLQRRVTAEAYKDTYSQKKNILAKIDDELALVRSEMIPIEKQLSAAQKRLQVATAALEKLRETAALNDPALEAAEREYQLATQRLADVREAGALVGAAGPSTGKIAGIGMGAGMLSMAPMMFGVHNETAMQMSMGLMMGSMASMFVKNPYVLGLILILSTLAPLLKKVIEAMSEVNRAMEGAFKTSKTEAEMLNIELKDINDLGLKPVTEEAKKASDAISSMADRIKELDTSDPLKQFVEGLGGLDTETQLKMLQNKYLTLRIQGVDDKEARDFIKAILKAAGLEVKLGVPFAGTQTATGTQAQMIAEQSKNAIALANQAYGMLDSEFSVSKYFKNFAESGMAWTEGWGTGADAARKAVEGLTESMLALIESSDVTTLDDNLKELETTMGKSADSSNLLKAAVRELYVQAGMLDVWDRFKGKAFTATRAIELLRLQAVGLADDLNYLEQNPAEIEVRYKYFEEYTQAGTTGERAISSLTPSAKTTTWQSKAVAQQERSAQKIADKQKLIVDQLQKELDLRNKILSAQDKQNQFELSRAEMQQQLTDALSTGDMAKAAMIQRKMAVEQAKYNEELKTTAMQNKLDKAKDRLSILEKELETAKKVTSNIQKQTVSLSDYSDELSKIITTGKGDLDGLAKTLLDKFGIPLKNTKDLVTKMQAEFKSNAVGQFAVAAGAALDDKLIPSQKQATILATYLNLLSEAAAKGDYSLRPEEAYRQALQSVIGGKISMTGNLKSGFRYFQNVGVGGNERTIPITNAGSIVPTFNPGGTGSAVGGRTIPAWRSELPKLVMFDKKSGSYVAMNNALYSQNPERYVTYEQYQGGVKTYAMGGMVKSYGMGGKVMNYFGGSWGGVKGPGSWTSDSIPAMVSNGEYVVNASAVSKVGTKFMDTLNTLGYANSAPLMSIISATGSPVLPVEIVKSNNNSSMYNNNSQIFVNVAGTNASAQDIANAISDAQQRRMGTVATRGVIYS